MESLCITLLPGRHGILYDYSASKNKQSPGFHKMYTIFSFLNMIFYVINVLNYGKKRGSSCGWAVTIH
jgi:hypothetical protein